MTDEPTDDVDVSDTDVIENNEDTAVSDLTAKVAESKAEIERERNARAESERIAKAAQDEARKAREEAAKANASVASSHLVAVTTAIDNVTRESEQATKAFEDAFNSGDAKAAALAQQRMAKAAAQMQALEQNKTAIEHAIKNPPRQQPSVSDVPVSLEAAIQGFTPNAQAWIKKHPETWRRLPDGSYTATDKLLGAHNYAIASVGVQNGDGPEYFKIIDQLMGYANEDGTVGEDLPDRDGGNDVEVDLAPKPAPRVSAPPSRSTHNGNGQRTVAGKVRLSAAEVEAADIAGVTHEEYAREKLKIAAENKAAGRLQ